MLRDLWEEREVLVCARTSRFRALPLARYRPPAQKSRFLSYWPIPLPLETLVIGREQPPSPSGWMRRNPVFRSPTRRWGAPRAAFFWPPPFPGNEPPGQSLDPDFPGPGPPGFAEKFASGVTPFLL